MGNLRKLLTTKEAAKYMADQGVNASPGTMEVWRCKGRGPRYRKIGGRWVRYATDDLDNFVRGQVVETVGNLGEIDE